MSGVTETAQWDDEVYLIEQTDPVEGGEEGIDNKPHKALANRSAYLKTLFESVISDAGLEVDNSSITQFLAALKSIFLQTSDYNFESMEEASGSTLPVSKEFLWQGEYGYWHEANIGLTGMVAFFAWQSSPRGFLKANGAEVSRTDYARLFSVIDTAFGAGDGVTTFNLPDLRGEFIRAWDDGRGIDPDRGLGTLQISQNLAHEHLIESPDTGNGIAPSNQTVDTNGTNAVYSYFRYGNGSTYVLPTDSDALRAVDDGTGGLEARPRNVALALYIKY